MHETVRLLHPDAEAELIRER